MSTLTLKRELVPSDGFPLSFSAPPDSLADVSHHLQPGLSEGSIGRIGHYDLREVVGRGSSAVVLRAFDEVLQRPVAIKILAPRYSFASLSRNAFLKEARAAARVRHEHVVQTYAVEEAPLPIIVMEYIEGETLLDRLKRTGPMDSAEAANIGRQIAIGIAAAHATGLIHRDIKPANILLEGGSVPWVKITDFGLAKVDDEAGETQSGYVAGTPMYMSPEQANGQALDSRSDLFSLGSLLYVAVTGKHPFDGPSSLVVMKRVIEEAHRPIRELEPNVHPGLCAVIDRLLSKSPADRYETAMDAADALKNYKAEVPRSAPSKTSQRKWYVPVVAASLLAATAAGFASYGGRVQSNPLPETEVASLETLPEPIEEAGSWERSVAALPVTERTQAVIDRLKLFNPGITEERHNSVIENGEVTRFHIELNAVEDISPLRAFPHLINLELFAIHNITCPLRDLSPLRGMRIRSIWLMHTSVSDLSPLAGLPLEHLNLWGSKVSDLSPLADMKNLNFLNCGLSNVVDLSPLRKIPLNFLCVNQTAVSDLSPLFGLPLTTLLVNSTKVVDLAPIQDLPIEVLEIRGVRMPNLDLLRRLPLRELVVDVDKTREKELIRQLPGLKRFNETSTDVFYFQRNNKP